MPKKFKFKRKRFTKRQKFLNFVNERIAMSMSPASAAIYEIIKSQYFRIYGKRT